MVELIEGIPSIGRVHNFPIRDRDDIQPLITSEIDGVNVLRAWWIHGPTMEGEWLTGLSPQFLQRQWYWEIHGVEGLSPGYEGDTRPPGGDIQTIRDNAVQVMDALDGGDDNELGLGHTVVFDSEPCRIRQQPFHAPFLEGRLPLAYVVIEKRIRTVPARS